MVINYGNTLNNRCGLNAVVTDGKEKASSCLSIAMGLMF